MPLFSQRAESVINKARSLRASEASTEETDKFKKRPWRPHFSEDLFYGLDLRTGFMTKRTTCRRRHRAILRRLCLLTYLRANAAPPRLRSGTTLATRHAPDSNLGRRQCVTRNFSQSRSANLGAAGPAGSSTRFQLRKTSMEETELIHRAPDSNLGRRQCTTDLLTY